MSKADELVERLRARAKDERETQSNNEAVVTALSEQMAAFERRDGSHNTYAVRLAVDHQSASRHDAALAKDWDEAASTITALQERVRELEGERGRLRQALIAAGRHAGALLADEVSTDFLMGVPDEVQRRLSRARTTLNGGTDGR